MLRSEEGSPASLAQDASVYLLACEWFFSYRAAGPPLGGQATGSLSALPALIVNAHCRTWTCTFGDQASLPSIFLLHL